MAPTIALTREPGVAVRLRRMAPWLIVLAIGALLMVPGIVLEPDVKRSGRALTTEVEGAAGAPRRAETSASPRVQGSTPVANGSPVASN